MRLISMSTHSHLKSLQDPLNKYIHTLDSLFAELLSITHNWQNSIIHPKAIKDSKTLLIIIGSQKGLCGSFNTHLFKLVSNYLDKLNYSSDQLEIIAVGQKAVYFARTLERFELKHTYEKCNAHRMEPIAQEITHTLIHAQPLYQSVLIASNLFKSFFAHTPRITTLIPFKAYDSSKNKDHDELIWEQSPHDILDALIPQYLAGQIHYLLFQSLFAEHAARFVSMDSATRNANSLLETTKLEYNKLRQAKITQELTELAAIIHR